MLINFKKSFAKTSISHDAQDNYLLMSGPTLRIITYLLYILTQHLGHSRQIIYECLELILRMLKTMSIYVLTSTWNAQTNYLEHPKSGWMYLFNMLCKDINLLWCSRQLYLLISCPTQRITTYLLFILTQHLGHSRQIICKCLEPILRMLKTIVYLCLDQLSRWSRQFYLFISGINTWELKPTCQYICLEPTLGSSMWYKEAVVKIFRVVMYLLNRLINFEKLCKASYFMACCCCTWLQPSLLTHSMLIHTQGSRRRTAV